MTLTAMHRKQTAINERHKVNYRTYITKVVLLMECNLQPTGKHS